MTHRQYLAWSAWFGLMNGEGPPKKIDQAATDKMFRAARLRALGVG
jgi:hypothetical protein